MSVRPFNRERINPIYKAGAVHINAKLNEWDNAERMRRINELTATTAGSPFSQAYKRRPYFEAPVGQHARSFSTCELTEFAFRNRDFTEQEMQRTTDMAPPDFSSDISAAVMTSLNLLGEYSDQLTDADMREAIAQKLQVLGIVVADNRTNNESNLTLMIDGVYTATNTCTTYIPPGWTMWSVPKRSDVAAGRVGAGYAESREGGRAALTVEPYDPSIHRHTPQRVYNCWNLMKTDINAAKEIYLRSYLELTAHLMHSVVGIVAQGLGSLSNEIKAAGTDNDIKQLQSRLFNDNDAARNKLIDDVFIAYGPNRNSLASDSLVTNAANASAIGEYMYACGRHVMTVLERVVGRALVGAAPKEDFDMILVQASR